jgi:cysteine desulfurase
MSASKLTYLDYNASAPLRVSARTKIIEALDVTSNPSSIHAAGRMGKKFIEDARRIISELFDVSSGQIIFTSSATEANNTILKGFQGQTILVSATEHLSILSCGVPVNIIPVDQNGILKLDALEALLKNSDVGLVSVMFVNNETGVIQPIKEIADLVHKYGVLLHVDAVQAVGRISFTREAIDADFITISSHKVGGALGAGAIIFKPKLTVPKLIEGGGQEKRQRAGTENFAAIAAMGEAVRDSIHSIEEFQKLEIWRDEIETELLKTDCVIFGRHTTRVANTICFSNGGKNSQVLLIGFDLAGIALSSGSACSSGSVQESHVLKSMEQSSTLIQSALRLSMGWKTSRTDIEVFLKTWDKLRG